ncbi:GNAT family N-acetyltransferase [Kitasatospora sp. Root107]|uniref:GNAT family N-acetyltransferase n=1 Tax=Kitasatospora sp. Root107 TaxID=1736424 RepID=UPI0007109D29|nr:GNAT family N-acetyltransferase [Kitasatospora sp. Root107]KQV13700.1 acetyltransferase [Kitasatospora sp. Root107]
MTDHQLPPAPVRLARYTEDDKAEILGDTTDAFGVAHLGLTWLPKEEHFGIRLDGRLVAHTGLLRLPIAIGELETEVMGVGGVAVAADLRGRGLARAVVGAALEHARTAGPPYGLLFCRPQIAPVYRRLGWQPVAGEVEVEQPGGVVVMPLCTMWTPLREGVEWPAGAVRLRSLPM